MPEAQDTLTRLVEMTRRLGDPSRDYAILAEGNSSARLEDGTFLVKASGLNLATIGPEGFVRVRTAPILSMLESASLNDEEIRDGLLASRVDQSTPIRPSVETLFHAWLLSLPDVHFIGHTHPTSVNAVLCSQNGEAAVMGRLFPDEIVVCGPAPVWVPYVDPGQPLARAIRESVTAYIDEQGTAPKIILMQNHGLIALGRSPADVEAATAMYEKTCRILLGAAALGGPRFLSEENVRRIHTRPDEHYRQRFGALASR